MTKPFDLKRILSRFRSHWTTAPDARKPNNNTRYGRVDALMAAFSVFFMQSRSFLERQRVLQRQKGRHNAASLFQIERIPSDQQLRNLLDPLPMHYFHSDFWALLDELRTQQPLQSFQSELGTSLVALDGLAFCASEQISCPECLKHPDRNGEEHFYHSAVTPVLVKSGCAQALPLPPEFIVPQDGHEKQDCERRAAKRWLAQHHAHFPPATLTYLGDDLYANQPVWQLIVETYPQSIIFVCKPASHAHLYEWLALREHNGGVAHVTKRYSNGKHHERWSYRFVNQAPMRSGTDALLVNGCEWVLTQEDTGKILYQNSFVTNHPLRRENVAVIAQARRTRWKIENENNNVLKTKGYHLEHNFGPGRQHLSNVLLTLNLLAFLLHSVQELTTPAYQLLRRTLGARKTFFDDLRALTRYLLLDSWETRFQFMADGLEISLSPP